MQPVGRVYVFAAGSHRHPNCLFRSQVGQVRESAAAEETITTKVVRGYGATQRVTPTSSGLKGSSTFIRTAKAFSFRHIKSGNSSCSTATPPGKSRLFRRWRTEALARISHRGIRFTTVATDQTMLLDLLCLSAQTWTLEFLNPSTTGALR